MKKNSQKAAKLRVVMNNRTGVILRFSLLELLVVLVIIGVIAAVAIPAIESLFDPNAKARQVALDLSEFLLKTRNRALALRSDIKLELDTQANTLSVMSQTSPENEDDSDQEIPPAFSFNHLSSVEGFYNDIRPMSELDESDLAVEDEQTKQEEAEKDVSPGEEEINFTFSYNRFGSAQAASFRLYTNNGAFIVTTDYLSGKPKISFTTVLSQEGDADE